MQPPGSQPQLFSGGGCGTLERKEEEEEEELSMEINSATERAETW